MCTEFEVMEMVSRLANHAGLGFKPIRDLFRHSQKRVAKALVICLLNNHLEFRQDGLGTMNPIAFRHHLIPRACIIWLSSSLNDTPPFSTKSRT